MLTDKDFLGPKERDARRKLKLHDVEHEMRDYSDYFLALERKLKDGRMAELKTRVSVMKREMWMAELKNSVLDRMGLLS